MGVREIDRSLEQWQMEVRDLRRRMILAPTPRERERWYPVWLLAQHAGSHHQLVFSPPSTPEPNCAVSILTLHL